MKIPKESGIPDADETKHDRDVLVELRSAGMNIDFMSAREEVAHHFIAIVNRKREKAHSRAHTITTSNPVPETEDVVLVDTESSDGFDIGRHSAHVMSDDISLASLTTKHQKHSLSIL